MEQHFHREMNEMRSLIAELGGHVEAGVGYAINSVKSSDLILAERVHEIENIVDHMEVEIEEHCLKVLALYQPVAKDLRLIVTTLKLINELESMADLAVKIADTAGKIPKSLFNESQLNLSEMGDKAVVMINMALDSFLQEDPSKAKEILGLEQELDEIHKENHRTVAKMIDKQEMVFTEAELILLSISRSLERIGDLATNIAEDVIYLVDAKIVRHHWEAI